VLVRELAVRDVGTLGNVRTLKEEDDVLAPENVAVTITAYDVPPVKPVNMAYLLATPASVAGTVVTPFKV
jgi:hypothetical protein